MFLEQNIFAIPYCKTFLVYLIEIWNLFQISFHDRKDEKNDFNLKKVEKKEPVKTKQKSEQPNGDIDKKFEVKVNKIEENICQWIDEETKTLKETLEKDISSIRSEVDNKNIEINSKVQGRVDHTIFPMNANELQVWWAYVSIILVGMA